MIKAYLLMNLLTNPNFWYGEYVVQEINGNGENKEVYQEDLWLDSDTIDRYEIEEGDSLQIYFRHDDIIHLEKLNLN